jgi:hypothetical protein
LRIIIAISSGCCEDVGIGDHFVIFYAFEDHGVARGQWRGSGCGRSGDRPAGIGGSYLLVWFIRLGYKQGFRMG